MNQWTECNALFFPFFVIRERNLKMFYQNSKGLMRVAVYPVLMLLQLKQFLHLTKDFLFSNAEKFDMLPLYKGWVIAAHFFEESQMKVVGIFELKPGQEKSKYKAVIQQSGIYLPGKYWRLFSSKIEELLEVFNLTDLEADDMLGKIRKEIYRGDGDKGQHMHYFWTTQNSKGQVCGKGMKGHLTPELAEKDYQTNYKKPMGGGRKKVIISQKMIPPPAYEYMRSVFCYLVVTKCMKKAVEMCEGCQANSPSQVDHGALKSMVGCLSPVYEKVMIYYGHIINFIKPQDLMELFNELRSVTNVNPIPAYQLAKAALNYIDDQSVVNTLRKKEYLSSPLTELIAEIGKRQDEKERERKKQAEGRQAVV